MVVEIVYCPFLKRHLIGRHICALVDLVERFDSKLVSFTLGLEALATLNLLARKVKPLGIAYLITAVASLADASHTIGNLAFILGGILLVCHSLFLILSVILLVAASVEPSEQSISVEIDSAANLHHKIIVTVG